MTLFAIGLNHRTAPIEVREAVAFTPDAQRAALAPLRAESGAEEVVLVSTCNRSEIYLRGEDPETLARATRWLRSHAPSRAVDLDSHLYRHHEDAVARHAMRVACGLDSMVLGEPQILGQVKSAVKIASEAGTLGGTLDRLFQQTFCVAKQVRAQTAIGESSVSMGAAAVNLARQLFGELGRIRVLLVGAGEMIELVAAHFAAQHPLEIAVANRTVERAQALAQRIGGSALSLSEVPGRIHEFDAVVSCTASTLPIIGKGMIERALRLRRRRPMYLVDLAVPRDIEPEVGDLPDVFLQTLDSLGGVIHENSRKRADAVSAADEMIEARVREFTQWLHARAAVPVIRELRSRTEHDRQIELARARQRLAKGDDPLAVIEALSASLTNKLLHPAMTALKRSTGPLSFSSAEASAARRG